jgi:hypothetical protein
MPPGYSVEAGTCQMFLEEPEFVLAEIFEAAAKQ